MAGLTLEAVTLQRFAGAKDVFFEVFEGFSLSATKRRRGLTVTLITRCCGLRAEKVITA